MFKNVLILLLVSFLFFRCSEEVVPVESEIGRDFYPVQIGNYWIYDVTETKVNNNVYDSTHYQVRELVDTVYTDLANEVTYRMVKSRRTNSNQPWSSDSLILLNKSLAYIRRTQSNAGFISLVFPVTEGKTWNANAFNTYGESEYQYQLLNKPFKLNDLVYDKTVTVVQGERNDVVLDDRQEVYANETGLIYKKFIFYEYLNTNGSLDRNNIAKGVKRIMKLNTFYAADK